MTTWRTKFTACIAFGITSVCFAAHTLAQSPASPDAAGAKAQDAAAPASPEAKFVRVLTEDDGKTLKLQLASRTLVRADGTGPTLYLTGAVHIADRTFYDALQKFLDDKDVVLFEGVKPPGAGAMQHSKLGDSAEERITATKRRIQLLALFVEKYKAGTSDYPARLDALPSGIEPKLAKMISPGMDTDAWGTPLVYELTTTEKKSPEKDGGAVVRESRFDIISYGADGKPGGDGPDADIAYSKQTPVKAGDLKEEEGIQQQLAQSMGLVFQLDSMDHNKPNWRNSDLSIDQLQDRLEMGGTDPDELFSMLQGGSFVGKLAGIVLKIVGAMPTLSTMLKMMMVDMLANADEMMDSLPGNMGAMMDVIIKDRNQVVMDDLAALIKSEPDIKTVGIIYGAGHLPDMEERLASQLGYHEAGQQWFTAITVDVTKTGMSTRQANQMRDMMKSMMQKQIKAAKKAK